MIDQQRNIKLALAQRLIHEIAPEFGTFCADYAKGDWPAPLEHTDHFSGLMSEANRKRLTARARAHTRPMKMSGE